jgi:hypothetical protein
VPVLLWLGFWGFRLLLNWYQYTRDIWVVTNQRVVDSTQPTPLNKRISTADLVNIQDISIIKRGVFASMFNFGDVVCKTAGGAGDFCIGGVPAPEHVQQLVDRERDRERSAYRSV